MRIQNMANTKTDVVVKLVLVFFISLLSFSIGTFVGKKYSDNQHQLSQLEPKKTHKGDHEPASVHEEDGADKKAGNAMSDDEIAKLAEEFVADETKPAETARGGDAHGEPHAATPAHEDSHAAAPATKNAHGESHDNHAAQNSHELTPAASKNTASTHESRVPTSLPKDVARYSVGKFTVQVASYADETEAQKTASDLKEKGYSAFYIPATIKGKTWYRVSVGQFATMKEATSYKSDLMSKAKVNTAIVQKITE